MNGLISKIKQDSPLIIHEVQLYKKSFISGIIEKSENWNLIRINLDAIKISGKLSKNIPDKRIVL